MVSVAILISLCGGALAAFPFEFSKRECEDLFPERLQRNPSNVDGHERPFHIEPLNSMYGVENSKNKVTVTATDKWMIRGIMMQARVADCSSPDRNKPIGHFEIPRDDPFFVAVNCSGNTLGTATNKDWIHKEKEVAVYWFPPDNFNKKIYFVATIVSDKNTFWTEVYSHSIRHYENKDGVDQRCPLRSSYIRKERQKSSTGNMSINSSLMVLAFVLTATNKWILS